MNHHNHCRLSMGCVLPRETGHCIQVPYCYFEAPVGHPDRAGRRLLGWWSRSSKFLSIRRRIAKPVGSFWTKLTFGTFFRTVRPKSGTSVTPTSLIRGSRTSETFHRKVPSSGRSLAPASVLPQGTVSPPNMAGAFGPLQDLVLVLSLIHI